ncbi:unnamed protein product [Durusdinium trenchii]|uniref:CWH43-like N-terminal domain-containing protein n=1 Tax=Durusdinium trenchii TaxID=1381693 RepID=A0ABP0LG41_9DINO
MAPDSRYFMHCCWAIPAMGALCGSLTMASVYYLTATSGHLPQGSSTPPLSFMGLRDPERRVYQVGFALTGLLLAQSVRIWRATIWPLLRSAGFEQCAYYGFLGGCLAAAGAALQGIVTLEADILEKISSQTAELSIQSKLHQAFALFFFIGCTMHCHLARLRHDCCSYKLYRATTGTCVVLEQVAQGGNFCSHCGCSANCRKIASNKANQRAKL